MDKFISNLYVFGATCVDGGRDDLTGLPRVCATDSAVRSGLQLLFGVVAIVTVIYIMIAGIKLMVDQGDPQSVAKSRQSIIYAALGLVIVLTAEIIVTFVLGRL